LHRLNSGLEFKTALVIHLLDLDQFDRKCFTLDDDQFTANSMPVTKATGFESFTMIHLGRSGGRAPDRPISEGLHRSHG
jgi:hypothetical protein